MLNKDKVLFYLEKFIKAGVLFILFLPLVMNSKFFFPFIVPKNVLFRVAVELIFAAYLILAYFEPRFRPKFNKLTLTVLAFFGAFSLAGILGINFNRSFWGNYERMGGIFHFLHILLYFFILVSTFKEKKDWHSFFTFSIFGSVVMSFLALAQWLNVTFLLQSSGGSRLSGTVGNPTFFAAFLVLNLFFILYFWAKERRFDLKLFVLSFAVFDGFLIISSIFFKLFSSANWGLFEFFKTPMLIEAFKFPRFLWPFLIFQVFIFTVWFFRQKTHVIRVLLSVIFIFEFFIFYQTQTRGAIIGFASGIGFLALVSLFLKINKKIKIVSLVLLILILISPLVLVASKDTALVKGNNTLRRLATISLTDLTTESRLLTWEASWKGWTESPKSFLIGYGPENYYYAFNKYFPNEIYKDEGSRIWFDRAHNIFFDVAVTTGVLGLLLYFAILILASLALINNYKKTKSVSYSWLLVSLIIAYFMQNFFVFDTLNTEIPFFLFLAFVAFSINNNNSSEDDENNIQGYKLDLTAYIFLATILVVLIGSLAINIKTLKANNYIFKALVSQRSDQTFLDSMEHFEKAIDLSVVTKYEARQQLANFVNGVLRNQQNLPDSKARELVDFTIDEIKESVAEDSKNIRQYLFLTTFLNATTRYDRGHSQQVIDILTEAIELSPTRPHIYYEIAQAYAFLNNYEKAEEFFSKGAELAPEVIADQWNLLTIYIVFGKTDLAERRFTYMLENFEWEPTVSDYQRVFDLYNRVNDFTKMIEFQEIISELEVSPENYAKLAAIYAKVGQNQKAREITQMAIDLDPNFATEAETFLDLLNKGELLEQ
tara:strand:+ start:2119 stop:4599 length:2481 start_codon:yes stop_codon:yes gene_type:complete